MVDLRVLLLVILVSNDRIALLISEASQPVQVFGFNSLDAIDLHRVLGEIDASDVWKRHVRAAGLRYSLQLTRMHLRGAWNLRATRRHFDKIHHILK